MHRCIQLARLGSGHVAPNPMVGSVLVCQDRIIGEGYHQQYGKGHAEVACIASVKDKDQHLISGSTLYVSLEPCAHFGKTPPCADLIIKKKIAKVIIGCRDPFLEVNGKGIEKLKAPGIEVETGILEDECRELNKRFFTFHTQHRPYIVLKWAQTLDGKMAPLPPRGGVSAAQPLLTANSVDSAEKIYEYRTTDLVNYGLLKQFVREHRSNPTLAEDTLWHHLRGKQLGKHKFRRQHIIGNFIADFVCLPSKLIIEVDGLIHQLPENKESDLDRTKWLEMKGFKVIRFSNAEVIQKTTEVLQVIWQHLKWDEEKNDPTKSWKRSADAPPLGGRGDRLLISNPFTNRLVHKWRSEEMAIVVGTNTALNDDPQLGTRLWPGKNPIRIVVDMNLRLPQWLQLFDGTIPTIIFNKQQHSLPVEKVSATALTGVHYYQITEDVSLVHQLLNGLYHLGIQSVLVEGGAQLLQSFIDEGLWDEARIITNQELTIGNGLPAPQLSNARLSQSRQLFSDVIHFYTNSGVALNN